jgi:hypothetical protein
MRFPMCAFILGLAVGNIPLVSVQEIEPASLGDGPSTWSTLPREGFLSDLPTPAQRAHMLRARTPGYIKLPLALTHTDQVELQRLSGGTIRTRIKLYSVTPDFLIDMESLHKREETYRRWPTSTGIPPVIMAFAGFFYSEFSDQVICPFCDIHLRSWQPHHDPQHEHKLWNPECDFVRSLPSNLSSEEREIRQNMVVDPPSREVEEALSRVAGGCVTAYDLPPDIDMEVIIRARHRYLSDEQQQRLRTMIARIANSTTDPRELFLPIQNASSTSTTTGMPLLPASSAAVAAIALPAIAARAEMANVAAATSEPVLHEVQTAQRQIACSTCRDIPSGIDVTALHSSAVKVDELVKGMLHEVDKMTDMLRCKICMDKRVEFVFLPCGHICACAACGLTMSKCPLCRLTIRTVSRVFM